MMPHTGSLGDLETLIMRIPSEYVTDDYPEECKPGFYRVSIGLEDAEDIINDIDQALKTAGSGRISFAKTKKTWFADLW